VIRSAEPADVPALLALVRELAAYEREPDAVEATEPLLHTALFDPDAGASCLVAEADGRVVGLALWFRTFSTWLGRYGIHLEDLYVQPAHRGAGHGRALLARLAQIAVERGWGRVEWQVLDWNLDAQGFYSGLGARSLDDWTTFRLDGAALTELATDATRSAPLGNPRSPDCRYTG